MLTDGANIHGKQLGHEFLGLPNGLLLATGLDALFRRLAGKDQKLGSGIAYEFFVAVSHAMALPCVLESNNTVRWQPSRTAFFKKFVSFQGLVSALLISAPSIPWIGRS
jgi:hypothetical protein